MHHTYSGARYIYVAVFSPAYPQGLIFTVDIGDALYLVMVGEHERTPIN